MTTHARTLLLAAAALLLLGGVAWAVPKMLAHRRPVAGSAQERPLTVARTSAPGATVEVTSNGAVTGGSEDTTATEAPSAASDGEPERDPCPPALAQAETSRPERFDDAWAMCHLYGNYDGESSRNDDEVATPLLSEDFADEARRRHVLVVGRQHLTNGEVDSCHACAGDADVYLYTWDGGAWHLPGAGDVVRGWASGGSNGNPPSVALVKLGPRRFGLEASGGGVFQGIVVRAIDLYDLHSRKLRPVGRPMRSEEPCDEVQSECDDITESYRLVPGADPEWFDLIIERKTRHGEARAPEREPSSREDAPERNPRNYATSTATERYVRRDGEYAKCAEEP